MFDEYIVCRDRIRPLPGGAPGARLALRLPWYRGLPLSCVERLEITIDGQRVSDEDVTLSLYGPRYALSELPGLHDVQWFTLDTADVHAQTAEPLTPGEHHVDVMIQTRAPYQPTNMGGGFKPVARYSKRIPLVGEDEA